MTLVELNIKLYYACKLQQLKGGVLLEVAVAVKLGTMAHYLSAEHIFIRRINCFMPESLCL